MRAEMLDLLREMCFRQEIIDKVLKIAKTEEEAVNLALELQENPSLLTSKQESITPKIPKKKDQIKTESIQKIEEPPKEVEKKESKPARIDDFRMVRLIR